MALLFREILSGLMSNKDAEYTICEIPMAKRWFISPVCSFLRLRSDPNCSDFTQIYFKSSLMISDEAEEFKQRWHRK